MLSNCAEKRSTIIPKNVDCIRENILNRSIISNAMREWFFILLLEWVLRHSLHPIPGIVSPPQYLRCYQSPFICSSPPPGLIDIPPPKTNHRPLTAIAASVNSYTQFSQILSIRSATLARLPTFLSTHALDKPPRSVSNHFRLRMCILFLRHSSAFSALFRNPITIYDIDVYFRTTPSEMGERGSS